ncbi:hypothetical protein [Elizabethkingia meningoseptica]|uniref:hypothetical protein n=1 Tax=Elizabethkingia meningoseptica TaxID=238 RepID=UPI000842069B|nr:hypothetical protein [Elizabethkingia meningoseptica]MEC4712155.1 hypothetical protein [Elizabethkingia meningoseptica]ODM55219.1 hypothetical protein BES09_01830 [Elizabethkingia meningoseptica]OHT30425.1 hypothetical protein BFF93_01840 [Elizabethkingia meningoseptica]OPC12160.1 hypothetical protein BAX93_06620 [Elizabethkingia meningoseptica]
MKKLTRSALKKTIGNGQKGPYLPEEWTGYCPNDCDEIENICIGGKSCRGFIVGTIDGQAECAICE